MRHGNVGRCSLILCCNRQTLKAREASLSDNTRNKKQNEGVPCGMIGARIVIGTTIFLLFLEYYYNRYREENPRVMHSSVHEYGV